MADSALSDAERLFFEELDRLGVRFLLVGASAAVLQGADTATQDLDLWFESLTDERIRTAAAKAGGVLVAGGIGSSPPVLGGELLGDRLDVVVAMHGLGSFEEEWRRSIVVEVDGVKLHVLPLERILESKRASGRSKDRAQIPSLEEALAAAKRRGD